MTKKDKHTVGDNDTEKFNLKNLQRTIIDHDKDMKVQSECNRWPGD